MAEGLVPQSRVWAVGALCRAVADALDARFNPVTVQGEIGSFSRAGSGHCYFSLKDGQGQLRCAMFRRAASLLDFDVRDGDLVEVRGRLAVYEPRGDLQLVVESMRRAGQGTLFEQFLQRKAKLEAEGLFDAARKRPLPVFPRRVGLVTSRGAAALHDVVTAMRRRAPHVEVLLAPASVQGAQAPAELIAGLQALQQLDPLPDAILVVRGGGSIEDLWAFNDEQLARAIVASRVPVVVGVGHETDFTIADFCADLRAPTPTAAAELVAPSRDGWLQGLDALEEALLDALQGRLDRLAQRLDTAAARLGRPSSLAARQQAVLAQWHQRLQRATTASVHQAQRRFDGVAARWAAAAPASLRGRADRLERAALRLQLLDPAVVLQRGYAWLADSRGRTITRTAQLHPGDGVRATLADGSATLQVTAVQQGTSSDVSPGNPS
ncbi:exodeoxyribonuclease VII large subunit [Pseudacidovorax intermedius]|uniref:Exodeoxyribonuclease 7 large subunit n=1 Tax=Pseudacidovorax intermedius TaxID=433924 RepID=A0A147GZN6_9BURK|nr:exodeoxyribonuclease VII large subunit [Pseudacidovorax intermedius]KTT23168.1 exodeoxyribonuclease VII [Pseudacidovorax intermedius]